MGEAPNLLSEFVFPDNTVLCNFAAVDRVSLLRAVLNGDGRWTEAVAYEARQSAQHLPKLAAVLADDWLGEPIEIVDDAETRRVEQIRRVVFGGLEDKPLQHLGESQTCFLIAESGRFDDAWWISDDREAVRYAKLRGITTRETIHLMNVAVVDGLITDRQAIADMRKMVEFGRYVRLPKDTAELWR
jgi:predicted nucleic acid-binding protein